MGSGAENRTGRVRCRVAGARFSEAAERGAGRNDHELLGRGGMDKQSGEKNVSGLGGLGALGWEI